MNDNIKKQIVALIEGVKAKDPKATQIMQDIMNKAQQGDRDAIALANAIQEVIKEMNGGAQQQQQPQGPVAAKFGAKLNYIRTLKGNAPEGMEVVYYKEGGQMKKKFVKSAGGAKEKDGKKEIANFKKQRGCNGFKTKKENGGELPVEKCGGKAKKHQQGGSLNRIPFTNSVIR